MNLNSDKLIGFGIVSCGVAEVRVINNNGVACSLSDKDECASGEHRCQHECINTIGSYECACPKGMYLNEDGRTCSSEYSRRINGIPILKSIIYSLLLFRNVFTNIDSQGEIIIRDHPQLSTVVFFRHSYMSKYA